MSQVKTAIRIKAGPARAIKAFLELDALKASWGVERGLVEAKEGGVYEAVVVAWPKVAQEIRRYLESK